MTRKVRKDIRELEDAYNAGDKKPLEDVIRAWRGIQKLHPDNKHSFFKIAGYHGEPFRGAGWGNPSWWGGYCNHGNVLFPVWHRAYLLELEKALQSIDGCKDVTLPYWNETDKATEESGLPKIFLQKTFPLDGVNIPNPLYSYKFQAGVYDNLVTIPDHDYTKPPEYQTVRYPWSGLVGTPDDVAITNVHNETLKQLGDDAVNKLLNDNVKNWLGFSVTTSDGKTIYTGNRVKYAKCLEAPNYTVFSNTTSAQQWNEDHFGVKAWREEDAPNPAPEAVVPLESPHNALHLAIGGFEVPGFNANNYPDASGDMGENDTASFDPIFFFHHSFIDKVFWAWQKKWNATKSLHIIDGYPGTNSVDNQGPTPGVPGNTWLDMDSPLQPFETLERPLWPRHMPVGEPELPHKVYRTGKELVNIHTLGYEYADYTPAATTLTTSTTTSSSTASTASTTTTLRATPTGATPSPTPTLRIPAISRAKIAGSFLISTWTNDELLHVEPVLSRWHVAGCENCQTHLSVKTFVPLYGWTPEDAKEAKVTVKVHTRQNRDGEVKFEEGRVGDNVGRIGGSKGKVLLGHVAVA